MGSYAAYAAGQAREAQEENRVLRWLLAESEWKRSELANQLAWETGRSA